jgi:hypothetical protein
MLSRRFTDILHLWRCDVCAIISCPVSFYDEMAGDAKILTDDYVVRKSTTETKKVCDEAMCYHV